MSKFKAILSGLIGTAYKFSGDEVAELLDKSDEELNESEILNTLKEKDKERVSSLRKKSFDEGYQKAEKKEKDKVEKSLKERFEIDSDKIGDELIDEIFEKISAASENSNPKEITDDDIKKHQVFLAMEKNYKKQITDQKTDFDTQLKTKEKEFVRKDVLGKVGKAGLAILEKMNPILSKDPQKSVNQKGIFLNEFDRFDFEENENAPGGFLVYKDGQLYQDEHGHRVDFDKLATRIADKYFDFEVAEKRDTPPPAKPNPNATKYNGAPPKTKDEYAKLISDQNIPLAERIAIRDAAPPEFKD
jgi:hypothetical protein